MLSRRLLLLSAVAAGIALCGAFADGKPRLDPRRLGDL